MKVQVCEHCAGEGMDGIIKELKDLEVKLKEESLTLEIEKSGCLGSCKGPVISVNGTVHDEVQPNRLQGIIEKELNR